MELDGSTGKLPWVGIGWYRKTFTLPAHMVGRKVSLDIDGAMSDATVYLNGTSLGRKKKGKEDHRLVWDNVKYQPGKLEVVAYKNGREWAWANRATTGPASKLAAKVETIGGMSFIELTVTDAEGREVPRSHPPLNFEAGGGLEILAVGNGDATSHASMWRAKSMPAYNGKCLAITRGKGTFTTTSPGLAPVVTRIE